MRQTLFSCAALVVILVAGCSSQNTGKLEGTRWKSLEITTKDRKLPAGALLLEFKADGPLASADGTVVYTIEGREYKGQYSLSRGHTVVFRFDKDSEIAGRRVHTEKIIVEGGSLTMTDTDGTKIPFTRAE